jgi:hypothetical protein
MVGVDTGNITHSSAFYNLRIRIAKDADTSLDKSLTFTAASPLVSSLPS